MEVDTETTHKNIDEEVAQMGQEESKIAEEPPQSDDIEQRLADEIRLRKFTEDVMDARQLELERQEGENRRLLAELEELRKELSETQSQVATKNKQILDAKDQIFRLQPTRKDITESEATEAYRALCGNVQRWVDNRLRPILDDLESGKLRGRLPSDQSGRFVSLMREAAKRGMSMDQTDTYHVIAVIMNYLCVVFFSKSFYSPLDDYEGDSTLVFIDELQSYMSKLPRGESKACVDHCLDSTKANSPIDVAQCREWRSETLIALTSQQAFKTRRIKYINLVASDLASFVSVVAPKASLSDLQGSLRRSVVEPAAELAHQLHTSSSVFSLKWPARGAWSRLEVYECLDLANGGQVLDLSGTGPSSPVRRNVSYLFDVAPGLFVERVEGGKKSPLKAICRPSVLVFGGDGEVEEKPTVLRWLWDNSSPAPAPPRQSSSRGPSTNKSMSASRRRDSWY